MAAPPPSLDALLRTLATSHNLHARPSVLRTLLTALLSTAHPPVGGAVVHSLKFRLLSTDITTSLQPYANLCLPPTLPDSAPESLQLPNDPIVVQVLDITDLTTSRFDALDRLEMAERGEAMRGREVVRLAPGEAGELAGGDGSAEARAGGRAMHKLLLEDAAGRRVWGFEAAAVKGVKVGMGIGAKMVLRGNTVARGVVLLSPATTVVMGGRVEALQKEWVEGRKAALLAEIEALREGGREVMFQ